MMKFMLLIMLLDYISIQFALVIYLGYLTAMSPIYMEMIPDTNDESEERENG